MRAWTIFIMAAVLAACAVDTGSEPEGALGSALAGRPDRCGTPEPTSAEVAAVDALEASAAATSSSTSRRIRTVNVPVYAHVITNTNGEGDVTALLPAQIDVLNAAYASAGFRFELVSTEVVVNDVWYTATADSPEEAQMKAALRRGGPESLNFYTGINDNGLLGWATFPWWYDDSPAAAINDGVVMHAGALPGGDFVFDGIEDEPDGVLNYAAGDTGTHEVGHWLGLYHTFEQHEHASGCEGRGDRVFDTPAEAEPQFICVARDSCTGRGFYGSDPIHNFMDYADDDCMTHFTFGQNLRMRLLQPFFRR
jgi:hypothetical protein